MLKKQKQQVFNKVVKFLRKQGEPAVREDSVCMYRQGTLMCAVGCLIDDKHYDSEFETQSISREGKIIEAVNASLGYEACADFLGDLQEVHDNWTIGEDADFEHQLSEFAKYRKLNYPKRGKLT